jgi:phage terminase large subunit GpA-like protein
MEFFKQLTAEQLVTRIVKGYPKREWQKTRDRNEALDCRIYARAAAIALGVELWSDSRWQKLQAQVMGESKTSSTAGPQSAPSKSITRNTRRRKSRSSIMG